MSDTPVLSIVTGTRSRPEAFKRLVESVHANTKTSWEMIVAQVAETPYLDNRFKGDIRFILEWPPLGPAKGYNRAFAECRGKWVIWLNDDCEVLPGWDEAAIEFMEKHPQVGIGALYYAVDAPSNGFWTHEWMDLPYANFGILRKEFGESLNPPWFDSDIHMYGNDNSIAFKTYLAGKVVRSIPHQSIVHYISDGDAQRQENLKTQRADQETLLRKYEPCLPQFLDTDLRCGLPRSPRRFIATDLETA